MMENFMFRFQIKDKDDINYDEIDEKVKKVIFNQIP